MESSSFKKRKCVFNDVLKRKYPFLRQSNANPKDESEVFCTFCGSKFSLAHGGNSDIQAHIATNKHKQSAKGAASTSSMANFCISKPSSLDEKKQKNICS